jgi:phosphomannomutase/phosphoglucomutase
MDLKEKLQITTHSIGLRHVDPKLVMALGLVGLMILAGAGWLSFSDWRLGKAASMITQERLAAVQQLSKPVQALDRVFEDEQVQALAARAIETPEATNDLYSYLHGRIPEIQGAQVYGLDLEKLDARDLGLNGYAVLDMLLSLQENKPPRLQIHHILTPPAMVDGVRVNSGEELVGYLLVSLDPEYVLSHFNPEFSSLGYIGLSQYNGRQASNILREVGEVSLVGEVPERQTVSGTVFRIEYPIRQQVTLLGRNLLVLMLVVGGALMAFAAVLKRISSKLPVKEAKTGLQDQLPAAATPAAGSENPMLTADEKPVSQMPPPDSPPPDNPVNHEPPPMHLRYDIAERRQMKEAQHAPVGLDPGIFRAYDIRGIIDKTLDAGIAKQVGQALGTVALESEAGPMVVARDGRLSGPYLHDGMIEGILSTGCDVLDIGAAPTGVLYYAAHELAAGSGVMITGSHNPPDYNGFKVMIGGDTLHGDDISALYRRIIDGNIRVGTGSVKRENVVPAYIERIASDIQIERPLKVVIDCGNGIGGVCAAEVLRAIGAEVLPLFDEVDGTFPNHHPDPSEPENLQDLIEAVRLMDADIGLALDGDADRLGVVTLAGEIIFADRVMMLLAMDVLDRNPGASIIYDVKCTGHLADVIKLAGGIPVMYKTGHSLIKAKMKEIGAPFAGEMSGHFFFKERWYGVDDGIYAAARLLEILASAETPPEAILNALPSSFSTPELKVHMNEGENFVFIDRFRQAAKFGDARISTIDGVRADFSDGWGLVRGSNTTPVLVVRFDAETELALERIKNTFREQMLAVDPDLELPF